MTILSYVQCWKRHGGECIDFGSARLFCEGRSKLFQELRARVSGSAPENNPHWAVYLAYRQCIDIILAERIPRDCIAYLQVRIQEFLEAFTSLYPFVTVTPKLHYLLHYPGFMQKVWPTTSLLGDAL